MPIFEGAGGRGRLPRHGDEPVAAAPGAALRELAGVKLGRRAVRAGRGVGGRRPSGAGRHRRRARAVRRVRPVRRRPPLRRDRRARHPGRREPRVRDDGATRSSRRSFSMWTTIEECLNPPVVWEADRAAGSPPRPSASRRSSTSRRASVRSSASMSSTRRCSSCRAGSTPSGSPSSTASGTSSSASSDAAHPRVSTGPTPVTRRGCAGLAADVVAAVLPDPASSATGCRQDVRRPLRHRHGQGRPAACTYLYHVVDNAETMAAYGAQCVVWQTAVNPVVALELLAEGTWSGAGVLGPEAFDAVPFLDLLAADRPAGATAPVACIAERGAGAPGRTGRRRRPRASRNRRRFARPRQR